MRKSSKILILTEALELQFFLKTVLEEAGFITAGKTSMDDALEQIIRDTPSMVLIDVMMPGKQGIAMYRQLKRHEKYKVIPVVMLSTLARETFFQLHNIEYSFPNKGMARPEGYLAKPPEAEELIQTIKDIFKDESIRGNKRRKSCH